MRRLRIRKLAKAEITSAFEWYGRQSPSAAQRFLIAVDDAVAAIEQAPDRHVVVRRNLRRVLLVGFPYAVYYKAFPTVISVVGVIHGHRHPDVWLHRAAP